MTPFKIVVADPPWRFGDKLPGEKRGAEKHYPCMKTEDICMLELPPVADDALLFLWRVAAMQEDALAVMHMWNFRQVSEIVWVKTRNGVVIEDDDVVSETDVRAGMGRYTRHCHEVCLIGTRGRGIDLVQHHGIKSVFYAERQEHSRKPEKFFDIVEKLTDGEGPYLELFSRRRRAGWVCQGFDTGVELKVRGKDAA